MSQKPIKMMSFMDNPKSLMSQGEKIKIQNMAKKQKKNLGTPPVPGG